MVLDPEHSYSEWEKEQADVLMSLKRKEVWILFSGGKDSSLALYFLHKASKIFGFVFSVHAGIFPKHRYTKSDMRRIDRFWKDRGVQIEWHDLKLTDDSLEKTANPCSVCQKTRKKLLYDVVCEKINDLTRLVLITAYTLSDLVSYSLEYAVGANYTTLDSEEPKKSRQRFLETGQRFYPILMMKGGFTIYRPILRFNEKDVARIIDHAGIPILSTPCLYGHLRPKRILESYYDSLSLDFDYDRVLDFARISLDLPAVNEYVSMDNEHFLKRVF